MGLMWSFRGTGVSRGWRRMMRRDVEDRRKELGRRIRCIAAGGSGRPSPRLPGIPPRGLAGVGLAFIDTVQARERPRTALLVGTTSKTSGIGLEAIGMDLGHGEYAVVVVGRRMEEREGDIQPGRVGLVAANTANTTT